MPWLKVYDDLPRHPKTTRLSRALGVERALVVGCLVCLWTWAFQYAEDGDLRKFTDEDLADAAHWPGDATEFVKALRSTGWIDKHFIHGWDEHAGAYLYDRNRHRKYLQKDGDSQETPRNLRQSSQLKIKSKIKKDLNPPPTPPRPSVVDDDEVLEGEIVTRVDGASLFDLVFWPSWPTGGSKKQARIRFLSHTPDEMEAIITAAGHYADHVQALRFTVRAEYFVGGEKSYWEEWVDGPPPLASNWFGGNGGSGAKQIVRDAETLRVVSEVYGNEEWS